MYIKENIKYINRHFPNLRQKLDQIIDDKQNYKVVIENTKSGHKTIAVNIDDKKIYLHSKYDPLKEAELIIDKYDIKETSNVLFWGVGLGYHINIFTERYPNSNFYIFEPSAEIFKLFIEGNSFTKYGQMKYIDFIHSTNNISHFFSNLLEIVGDLVIIALPSYERVFSDMHKEFLNEIQKKVLSKKSDLVTSDKFERRWTYNSLKNFKDVLNSPNILLTENRLKNKPAIIISAGPSLDYEIENLKHIKNNGLAYLFSVGSSINTLIEKNVYPDYACTYDPSKQNNNVFQKLKELKISTIPLIFGSSVGYETLEDYQGKKYHMLTNQDSISKYFLKHKKGQPLETISDASSVAIIATQLLIKLGCSPIIFVGQNLGFKDNIQYSEGIDYHSREVHIDDKSNTMLVEDVYGNTINTTASFNIMRSQLEEVIEKYQNQIEFINTTKGGAKIQGAEFIEMEELLREKLLSNLVESEVLLGLNTDYDLEYIKSQAKKIKRSQIEFEELLGNYQNILNNIQNYAKAEHTFQWEKEFNRLDTLMTKIEKSEYFRTIILPMTRVYYSTFPKIISKVIGEEDKQRKIEMILLYFGNYLSLCRDRQKVAEKALSELLIFIEGIDN